MKRTVLIACTAIATLLASARVEADTLTILHMSDSHSHLAPGGSRDTALQGTLGGLARAAAVIATVESQGGAVLSLHAGDFFIGDLFFNRFFGVPELRLLAAVGLDAMTLGNHEFDLTPSTLSDALDAGFEQGGFPLLSANLVFPDTGFVSLRSRVQPYTIRDFGDLRVGIFGLTTPSTNLLSLPGPLVLDTAFLRIAADAVDSLETYDCDVIIALSHLGLHYDAVLAASVAGIDVIVGGHDHYTFEQPLVVPGPDGGTTLLVQSGPYYQNLGHMRLAVDGDDVSLADYALIHLDAQVPEAPQVTEIVDGLIEEIEGIYGPVFTAPITYAATDIVEVVDRPTELGFKDTPLGNIVADAFRAATGTQIALEPSGSIAEMLYAGPIVGVDAFRAVGYGFNTVNGLGFRIATLKLPGSSLVAALEFGLSDIEVGDDYIIQASGLSYRYDPTDPAWARVVDVKVGGVALDPTAEYTVTANEFALAIFQTIGADFSDVRIIGDTTEFQVLSGYLASFDTVRAVQEGRIEALVRPGAVRENAAAADRLALECRPNPTSGGTMITYRLARASHVSIELFDARGTQVATVLDAPMPPGAHAATLDASTLADGAYLCRVSADGRQEVRVVRVVHGR